MKLRTEGRRSKSGGKFRSLALLGMGVGLAVAMPLAPAFQPSDPALRIHGDTQAFGVVRDMDPQSDERALVLATRLVGLWWGSGREVQRQFQNTSRGGVKSPSFLEDFGYGAPVLGRGLSIRTANFRTVCPDATIFGQGWEEARGQDLIESRLEMLRELSQLPGSAQGAMRGASLLGKRYVSIQCECLILLAIRMSAGESTKAATLATLDHLVDDNPRGEGDPGSQMSIAAELWRCWIEGAIYDLCWGGVRIEEVRGRLVVYLEAEPTGTWSHEVAQLLIGLPLTYSAARASIEELRSSKAPWSGTGDATPSRALQDLLLQQSVCPCRRARLNLFPACNGEVDASDLMQCVGEAAVPQLRNLISDGRLSRLAEWSDGHGIRYRLLTLGEVACLFLEWSLKTDLPRWDGEGRFGDWARRAVRAVDAVLSARQER